MTKLKLSNIVFYSQGDEENLFKNLDSLDLIDEICGRGRDIVISINDNSLDSEKFLTLYSIFKRYQVDCRQLRSICSRLNEIDYRYISSQSMIWYADVFED